MINDQKQLEHTIKAIADMYRLRDREEADTLHSAELRADTLESTEAMIRKLERELSTYLARKYGAPAENTQEPVVAA